MNPVLTPEQLVALIGGGECFLHNHPNTITLDQLHRMYQLEVVVWADQDYTCRAQDDFVFVDSTAGPITITLHPADYGQHITISRIKGTNPVTVAAAAGETVNLQPSITITTDFTPRRLKALSRKQNITPLRTMTPVYGYLEI